MNRRVGGWPEVRLDHRRTRMQHTPKSLPPPIPTNQDEKGARAIEVAAMLGDTVVGVRHLRDPRGGALSRKTLGLIGGAALLTSISIAAFAAGVKNEANNARAFTNWVDRDGKPAADFRPINLGVGYDWLA